VSSQTTPKQKVVGKGKEKRMSLDEPALNSDEALGRWSQKSVFLAIYAKYLAGEKRRDEESEMILGPADGGMTMNKELPFLIKLLGDWLKQQEATKQNGGGWLEYLYGILLAKNKTEETAKEWFLKSVHLYPFNWGGWQELSNLLKTPEEVCDALFLHSTNHFSSRLSNNFCHAISCPLCLPFTLTKRWDK
jgi:anaphase-promoting complex subunit 8